MSVERGRGGAPAKDGGEGRMSFRGKEMARRVSGSDSVDPDSDGLRSFREPIFTSCGYLFGFGLAHQKGIQCQKGVSPELFCLD